TAMCGVAASLYRAGARVTAERDIGWRHVRWYGAPPTGVRDGVKALLQLGALSIELGHARAAIEQWAEVNCPAAVDSGADLRVEVTVLCLVEVATHLLGRIGGEVADKDPGGVVVRVRVLDAVLDAVTDVREQLVHKDVLGLGDRGQLVSAE